MSSLVISLSYRTLEDAGIFILSYSSFHVHVHSKLSMTKRQAKRQKLTADTSDPASRCQHDTESELQAEDVLNNIELLAPRQAEAIRRFLASSPRIEDCDREQRRLAKSRHDLDITIACWQYAFKKSCPHYQQLNSEGPEGWIVLEEKTGSDVKSLERRIRCILTIAGIWGNAIVEHYGWQSCGARFLNDLRRLARNFAWSDATTLINAPVWFRINRIDKRVPEVRKEVNPIELYDLECVRLGKHEDRIPLPDIPAGWGLDCYGLLVWGQFAVARSPLPQSRLSNTPPSSTESIVAGDTDRSALSSQSAKSAPRPLGSLAPWTRSSSACSRASPILYPQPSSPAYSAQGLHDVSRNRNNSDVGGDETLLADSPATAPGRPSKSFPRPSSGTANVDEGLCYTAPNSYHRSLNCPTQAPAAPSRLSPPSSDDATQLISAQESRAPTTQAVEANQIVSPTPCFRWAQLVATHNFGILDEMSLAKYVDRERPEKDIHALRNEGFVHVVDHCMGSSLSRSDVQSGFFTQHKWEIINSVVENRRLRNILKDWFGGPCVIAHWMWWGSMSTAMQPTAMLRMTDSLAREPIDVPWLGLHLLGETTGIRYYARSHKYCRSGPCENGAWYTISPEALKDTVTSPKLSSGL